MTHIVHLYHHTYNTESGQQLQSVSGKKGEATELIPELRVSILEERESEEEGESKGQEEQLEITTVEPQGHR